MSSAPDTDSDSDSTRRVTFHDAVDQIATVEGWLRPTQARRLWDRARRLRPGDTLVEIGSFHGRSMIVQALAAPEGVNLVAIDPHAGSDRGPNEIDAEETRGDADHRTFNENLERAGVRDRVTLVRAFSDAAHAQVDADELAVLYVDGAHRFAPARADIRDWGARVRDGGTLFIHDSFNSVGVTGAQFAELVFSNGWRYEGRSHSLTEYTKISLSPSQRANNIARQMAEIPYFAWALTMKALVAARMGELTKKLGNPDGSWPY